MREMEVAGPSCERSTTCE